MRCTCRSLVRFMSMRALEGIIAVLLILFIPNLPPHCKIEKPFKIEPVKPFEGGLALNDKLDGVRLWHDGDFKGPESFAVYNGELYTSLHSGDVVKLTGEKHITPVVRFGEPCKNEFEERKCGRPLGLAFDRDGYLYVADAYHGIFKVDVKTGHKKRLVSPEQEINGKKPMLFNSIAVSSSGDVYFTDSSTQFILEDGVFDMLADGTGRLIHYNPKTEETKELMTSLRFANGLVLSENEDYLLVSETGHSRVHKYHLKGTKSGSSEIFVHGLPGFPDNMNHDGHGGYFVSLVSPHDADHPSLLKILGPFPLARKFISRVMGLFEWTFNTIERVYPSDYTKMGAYFVGHFSVARLLDVSNRTTVVRLNSKGDIIDSYHTHKGHISSVSDVFIYKGDLLFGSPFQHSIGRIPLKDLGLSGAREKREVKKEEVKPAESPKVKTTEAPKVKTTQAPKVKVTEAPKVKATEAPKVKTTEAPKVKATEAPKVKATEAPKVKTTEAPKVKTTQVPKVKATEAPKVKTTEAPKVKATEAPKVKPSEVPKNEAPKAKPTEAPKAKPTEAPRVKATEAPKVRSTETPKAKTAEPPNAKTTTNQKVEAQAKPAVEKAKVKTSEQKPVKNPEATKPKVAEAPKQQNNQEGNVKPTVSKEKPAATSQEKVKKTR